jgi:hypothetical protein
LAALGSMPRARQNSGMETTTQSRPCRRRQILSQTSVSRSCPDAGRSRGESSAGLLTPARILLTTYAALTGDRRAWGNRRPIGCQRRGSSSGHRNTR